jgi:hypothetical protein
LPCAGRYWRDLMVRLLRSVSRVGDGMTITLAYRVEDDPSAGVLPERASVD